MLMTIQGGLTRDYLLWWDHFLKCRKEKKPEVSCGAWSNNNQRLRWSFVSIFLLLLLCCFMCACAKVQKRQLALKAERTTTATLAWLVLLSSSRLQTSISEIDIGLGYLNLHATTVYHGGGDSSTPITTYIYWPLKA